MIDRIRLTAAAKTQLSTLKRKTGIEHYNSICRHALCISLANPSMPPEEIFNFTSGIEIDWRTFTGGQEDLYLNLIIFRLLRDAMNVDSDNIRMACTAHVHRGISYLAGQDDFFIGEKIGGHVSPSPK